MAPLESTRSERESERSPDDSFLDALLGEFIETLAEGREIDVDAAARGRETLRGEIESVRDLARTIAVRRAPARPKIADFEIVTELGRGGMGTVYLAQDPRLGRRVAVKVLAAHWGASSRARERFEREARAIAKLKHPCIVPLYDVGEDQGAPWFSMEWIEGRPLSRVLAALRQLKRDPAELSGRDFSSAAFAGSRSDASTTRSPRASYVEWVCRVAIDVADALEHSHAQGVFHRDVKPSNVMIRGDGRALLFDFGLASVASDASLTRTGEFMGTPHYVSPEQAAGHLRLDDPRGDVYSLGATLYELLTLRVPFEGASHHVVLERIHNGSAIPPRRHNASVPRDLETVCLTALERDPERRYRSAAEFAQDLRRFLEFRPVLARPVGRHVRVARFLRRHWAVSSAAASAMLALIATPTALWLQQRVVNAEVTKARDEARHGEQEALQSLRLAEEHNRFVRRMLDSARVTNEGDTTVSALLDAAAKDLRTAFADRPALRAMLEVTVGSSYTGLARYPEALQLLSSAVSELEAIVGRNDPRTLLALQRWSLALADSGDLERAIQVGRDLLERARGSLPDDDEIVIDAKTLLSACLRESGELDAALALSDEATAAGLATLGDSSRTTLTAMYNFARALQLVGRVDESACWMERVLRVRRREFGDDDVESLQALSQLAQLEGSAGRWEDAAEIGRESAWRCEQALGIDNSNTWITLHNAAYALDHSGHAEEAERWERLALARTLRTASAADLLPQQMLQQLAGMLFRRGALDEAIAVLAQAVDGYANVAGPADAQTVASSIVLARMLGHAQRNAEGVAVLRERLESVEEVGAGDVTVLDELASEIAWLEGR